MGEWKEGMWTAVSALLVSVFLFLLYTIQSTIGFSVREEQTRINMIETLKEYNAFGMYEDQKVKQTDVVNCILRYRDKYTIYCTDSVVSDSKSAIAYAYQWNKNTNQSYCTLSYFNAYLPVNSDYRAFVTKDANGAVVDIRFKRLN